MIIPVCGAAMPLSGIVVILNPAAFTLSVSPVPLAVLTINQAYSTMLFLCASFLPLLSFCYLLDNLTGRIVLLLYIPDEQPLD